jgi:hypothetical protein
MTVTGNHTVDGNFTITSGKTVDMGSNILLSVGTPSSATDAATKGYVDTADALKLALAGGTMSGAIAMGTNAITGMADPSSAQDAATKNYVDGLASNYATAAQGATADSALQPSANISTLTNDSGYITASTTDTLTNKTLTAPVISSISNTGTLTLPTSTGTIALTSDLYTNSDVDTHLNQSNPTSGFVLSWNGSDYAWVSNGIASEADTLETVTNRGATTINGITVGSVAVDGLTITDNNITASRSNDDIILDPAGTGTVDINANRIRISNSKTPASALGAAGDQEGDIAWDASYIYVCTANYNGATNIWKRTAISDWA